MSKIQHDLNKERCTFTSTSTQKNEGHFQARPIQTKMIRKFTGCNEKTGRFYSRSSGSLNSSPRYEDATLSGRSRVRRARMIARNRSNDSSTIPKMKDKIESLKLKERQLEQKYTQHEKTKYCISKGKIKNRKKNTGCSTHKSSKVETKYSLLRNQSKPHKRKEIQRNKLSYHTKISKTQCLKVISPLHCTGCTGIYDKLFSANINENMNSFTPKPSKKIKLVKYACKETDRISADHDGDTWVEIKVVRKIPTKEKRTSKRIRCTRSLFYSLTHKVAYWDEPPSGATKILFDRENFDEF